MTPQHEDRFASLHLEINEHLTSLRLLHHKQQIANIHQLSSQVIQRLQERQCSELLSEVELLSSVIETNLETSNLSEIVRRFSLFLQKTNDELECEDIITDLKSYISTYLNLISTESTDYKEYIHFTDLSKVDTIKAYKTIIDPLSNQKRLDILLAIHNQKRRFKELEEELDLQAGHLIYHLNPLKEGGYVTQDAQKNYRLSDKGNAILEAIKEIYETYVDH